MSIMAVGLMAVTGFVAGSVIDFISLTNQKQSLQAVADRAALAAAQELVVSAASDTRVNSVAQSYVDANYKAPHQTSALTVEDGKAVTVRVSAASRTFFPGPLSSVKEISAEATAAVSGGGYICMVGLDESSVATLKMMNRARLSAEKCAVYSNSVNPKSLWMTETARISAEVICVAGGFHGDEASFPSSQPVEDCPTLSDPLRGRPAPDIGRRTDCDYHNTTITRRKVQTLRPGIYCGGITVLGGTASLQPGVYVMKDGQLSVTAGGTLSGDHVGFFLTGPSSTILFGRDSKVSLTAPKTGDLAGLLFFEDRDTQFQTYHRITSRDARNLVGTMYFPKSKLLIDANNPVADRSDYTIIIAREFELRDGPELVLNTNYESSSIPVPEGVGNQVAAGIRLVR